MVQARSRYWLEKGSGTARTAPEDGTAEVGAGEAGNLEQMAGACSTKIVGNRQISPYFDRGQRKTDTQREGVRRIKGSGSEVKAEGGDFRQKILPDLDEVTRITLLSALNNLVVWACLHGEGEKSLGKPERLPFSKGIERKNPLP